VGKWKIMWYIERKHLLMVTEFLAFKWLQFLSMTTIPKIMTVCAVSSSGMHTAHGLYVVLAWFAD